MLRSEQPAGAEAALGPRRLAPGVPWLIGLSAVLVGTLVLVVGDLATPTVATASGLPRALTATPIDRPVDDVLAELAEAARAHPEPVAADGSHLVEYESWGVNLVEGAAEIERQQPIRTTQTIRADGSTTTKLVAAGNASITPSRSVDVLPPGTVVSESASSADPRRDLPASRFAAAADVAAAIEDGRIAQDGSAAAAAMTLIAGFPGAGLLGGAPTAAVLDYLRDLDGTVMLGEVVDRLGRSAIAFAPTPQQDVARTMLAFDPVTGRLLSAEVTYEGALVGFALPADSVIGYTAWEKNRCSESSCLSP